MFGGIIWDHHDVQFKAQVALSDGVDVGDVRTFVIHRFHELLMVKTQVVQKGLN